MENQFLKIESYISEELSPREISQFEQAMADDPELKSAVDHHILIIQSIKTYKLRKKVKAANQDFKRVKRTKFIKQISIAAACSISLLICAVWFIMKEQSESIFNTKEDFQANTILKSDTIIEDNRKLNEENTFDHSDNLTIAQVSFHNKKLAYDFYIEPINDLIRSPEDTSQLTSVLELAWLAFNNKDYIRCINLLEDANKLQRDESVIYLRAHSNFKVKRFSLAANDFKSLEQSFLYKSDAMWNHLISNIAEGKTLSDHETMKLMNLMIQNPDFPYHDKAIKLKSRLK